jgi:hypothetical protein
MAVDERLRRLAPIVTGGAGFGIAALKMRGGGVSEREVVACALIAVAAALVAYAVATVRGSAGVIAGAVAGLWLAATAAGTGTDNRQQATGNRQQATGGEENGKRETGNGKRETKENRQPATGNRQPAMETAAASGTDELALSAAAIVAALCLLLARADKDDRAPRMFVAPIATALIIFEPRAWALAGVVAALVAWRERGRRRWLAAAPAIAGIIGGVLTLMAAIGRAPTWAPHASHVGPTLWIENAVDVLGPVAIIVGAIGVAIAINDRRARWTSMAITGALLAALPLTTATPSTALVGLAMALGMALTAVAVRVGRTRNQAFVGAALAAVLVAQLLL